MRFPIELLSDNFIKNHGITEDTPFQIEEVDAVDLLSPKRIDLAAKLAYIEARENSNDFEKAKELYIKHIEAFSEGNFYEPGDENKTNIESFLLVFDSLIDDIKNNGFDSSKSLIPVGKDSVILDGAHRTACAIYFKKKVSIIRFDGISANYDYEYFQNRYLGESYLRKMTETFIKYSADNLYCCCLWPAAHQEKRPMAIDKIKENYQIVYQTAIDLSINNLRDFMINIYGNQSWIGSKDDNYSGVMGKVNACFKPGENTGIVIFKGINLNDTLKLKDDMRDIFKLDKHALHISDTNSETQLMAHLLFSYDNTDVDSENKKAEEHWKKEKRKLKVKQTAYSIAQKLGVYKVLHNMYTKIRK